MKALIRYTVLLLHFSILAMPVHSQEFPADLVRCDNCSRQVNLDYSINSFFKNNEYSNAFTRGFTGIGYNLSPSLVYHPTDRLAVSTGVFLQQYAGREAYDRVIPLFRIDYRLSDQLRVIAGSLKATLFHGLEEPLLRFDRFYSHPVEYGLQILFDGDRFKGDLWLNWDAFIEPGDTIQESFQLGLTSHYLLLEGGFSMELPLQMLVFHRGGETNVSPFRKITILNGVSGLRMNYRFGQNVSAWLEPLYFIYRGPKDPVGLALNVPYADGQAIYLKSGINIQRFKVSLAYWKAENFISPYGEHLFLSVSDYNLSFDKSERQLLTGKLSYITSIGGKYALRLALDSYYDLDTKHLAHAISIIFDLDDRIKLTRVD